MKIFENKKSLCRIKSLTNILKKYLLITLIKLHIFLAQNFPTATN